MFMLTWLRRNWAALLRGQKLRVRVAEVGHPRDLPHLFRPTSGWPDGQSCDFAMRLEDGSRVHAQCYKTRDGVEMLRIHRDRFDPDRGPVELILHGLFETPAGPVLGALALFALLHR